MITLESRDSVGWAMTCLGCKRKKDHTSFNATKLERTDGGGFRGTFEQVCKACKLKAERGLARAIFRSEFWSPERIRRRRATASIKASRNRESRDWHITNACPPWVNWDEIEEVYEECQRLNEVTGEKHHVDHIIPLRNPIVCGLHVPWNLQVLPALDNIRKRNKFDQDNPLASCGTVP